jgi:hypothetical protein
MVKLIPVLVANSVSRNIVPGILKAIERNVLIYDLDDILDQVRKDLGINIRKVGKKIIVKEDEDQEMIHFLSREILHEADPYDPYSRHQPGTKGKGQKQAPVPTTTRRPAFTPMDDAGDDPSELETMRADATSAFAKEFGKGVARKELDAKDATVTLGSFEMKAISLEPTWMKTDLITKTGERYSRLIGVKAIPVVVKSDAQLHDIIMWDAQIGRLMTLILTIGRKWQGFLYRLWARTIGKIISTDYEAITGNPYRDIVLRKWIIDAKYVNNVFFVLNRADLKADFFEKAKRVRKLMKLGWQSFVIADDVNRSVSFCMEDFRGMCSTLPYSMLYQSLDQAKVFDDLEDVRRSSASLFRTRRPFSKIIGEGLAQQKLEEFSAEIFDEKPEMELLNEIEIINENVGQFFKKIASNQKAAFTRFIRGNLKIPSLDANRVAKIGNKLDPEFYKSFELAKKVLANSIPELKKNERLIAWGAITIVAKGILMKGGQGLIYGTKQALKFLIPKLRQTMKKASTSTLKVPREHMFQVAFGTFMVMLISVGIGAAYIYSIKFGAIATDYIVAMKADSVRTLALAKQRLGTALDSIGGNVDKVVKDVKQTVDDIKETTGVKDDMPESGEEMALYVGILMISAAAFLVVLNTLKGK